MDVPNLLRRDDGRVRRIDRVPARQGGSDVLNVAQREE